MLVFLSIIEEKWIHYRANENKGTNFEGLYTLVFLILKVISIKFYFILFKILQNYFLVYLVAT